MIRLQTLMIEAILEKLTLLQTLKLTHIIDIAYCIVSDGLTKRGPRARKNRGRLFSVQSFFRPKIK